MRQSIMQQRSDPLLMRRPHVAVQERDGDAFNRILAKSVNGYEHRSLIKGMKDLPVRGHTLDDGNAPIAWNKRRLLHKVDVVLIEPTLRADLDRVAKSFCG